MTTDDREELARVAEPVRPALAAFVRGETSADQFETDFLEAFHRTGDTRSEPVGRALDRIFFAVEDFVGHGLEVVPEEGDIDAGELLRRARTFVELVGWNV